MTRHDLGPASTKRHAFLEKYRAWCSLNRAAHSLIYKGQQWERGEAALATKDAVILLRAHSDRLHAEMMAS